MKLFVLLPLVLASASCFYPEPYPHPPQHSPYRRGGSQYYPDGRDPEAGPRSEFGPETGRYQQLPDEGTGPRQPDTRPTPAPRIDDDFDPQPPAPQPKPRQDHPVAETTDTPGRVLSPYPPYNVIDVEGFKSGSLAKDPSNGKIFRVP